MAAFSTYATILIVCHPHLARERCFGKRTPDEQDAPLRPTFCFRKIKRLFGSLSPIIRAVIAQQVVCLHKRLCESGAIGQPFKKNLSETVFLPEHYHSKAPPCDVAGVESVTPSPIASLNEQALHD